MQCTGWDRWLVEGLLVLNSCCERIKPFIESIVNLNQGIEFVIPFLNNKFNSAGFDLIQIQAGNRYYENSHVEKR